MFRNDDAVLALIQGTKVASETQQQVLEVTEEDAVIVSQRNDKLFWPERETIHFQNNNYAYLGELSSVQNLYWYTELPISHIYDIEKTYLAPNNMAFR